MYHSGNHLKIDSESINRAIVDQNPCARLFGNEWWFELQVEKELREKMRWKAENEETKPAEDGSEMNGEEAVRGRQLFDTPMHSNNDQEDHVGIRSKGKRPKSSKASSQAQ